MSQTFAAIPQRQNSDKVVASWWNVLQAAGAAIEAFLGAGYIGQTNFSLTNGQASPTNITGMVFDHTLYTSAQIPCEVNQSTTTGELMSSGMLYVFYRPQTAAWDVFQEFAGDDPGLTLSVTAGGQVQYTLGTLAGSSYVGTLKFKAATFNI